MKLYQWNQTQNNIFQEIETLLPTSVISVLGSNFLSNTFMLKFGDRTIPKKLEEKSTSEVAEIIAGVFSQRWTKLYDLAEEIAYYTGFDSETIIEETNLDSLTKSILSENIGKVTAFDSDVLSTDDSQDNTLTETNNNDKVKSFSKKERDIVNIDIRRRMVDNSNIVDIVLNDVVSIVGLQIY